jgi:hypothetical protein
MRDRQLVTVTCHSRVNTGVSSDVSRICDCVLPVGVVAGGRAGLARSQSTGENYILKERMFNRAVFVQAGANIPYKDHALNK